MQATFSEEVANVGRDGLNSKVPRQIPHHHNLKDGGQKIHNPELVQRLNAQIQSGHFHEADELLEKAFDALEGKTPPAESQAAERRRAAGRKSLVEVFAPLRGMNLDFSRNQSGCRPVDLG